MNHWKKVAITLLLTTLPLATSAFAAVTHRGGAVAAITTVTESNPSTSQSTSFADVPGAGVTITVPAGQTQLVQARFTAESTCWWYSGAAYQFCSLRVLADSTEMLPKSGKDAAFDSNGQFDDAWEGNSMERALVLGPGMHRIKLQAAVTDPGISFTVDDWVFTVTQYNNGK
jgi:hypothetical protein